MTITFERSVGANSDVYELEYIAALMQTEKMFLRKDGSLTARDIHFYLKSRHGLRIPIEQVEREIICELGGTAILRKLPATSTTGGDILKKSSVSAQDDEQPLVESNIEGSTLEEGISVSLIGSTKASVNDSAAAPYSSVETEEILRDEGDVPEEKDKPRLDMAQIASLLLIPKLLEIRVTEDEDANNKRASTYFTRADSQEKRDDEMIDMIDGVLAVILKETDLHYDDEITKDVLRKILSCFNEVWSDEVLETMLRVASCPPDSPRKFVREARIPATPRLNRTTLVRVLTEDLAAYDVDLDNTKASPWAEATSSEDGETGQYASDLERIYTASNIDANAQTYKSTSWHIWVWFCIVATLFAYVFRGPVPTQYFLLEPDCSLVDSKLACAISTATRNWIEVFIKLSVLGFPIVYLSTLGNSVYLDRERQRWLGSALILVAMISISVYVALPFFYHADLGLFHSEKENNSRFMAPVSLVSGCIVLWVQFSHFLRLHIPSSIYQRFCCHPCARPSNVRKAREMKEAANYKIDKMIRNALSCHVSAARSATRTSTRSHPASTRDISEGGPLGNAIVRFQQSSVTQIEEVGGIIWMWKRARDRSLFYEEGINVFPRLIASNMAQWFVVLIIIGSFVFGLNELKDEEELFQEISNKQLRIALWCGILPALIASVSISIIYIPSAVTTVLKYRAGINGSLRDRRFLQNRFAMDSANLLFGAAFWTCLCSSGLIAGTIGIFVCLCLYDNTQPTMVVLCSNTIGMLITMTAKQIIMLFLRSRWSRGFYRSRPAAVNISNTVQEVWNLGLTTFTAFVRALKFLAIFLFYLGRIDVQIFAPGIGWFVDSIPLDGLPHCFLRDLLLNEAHRHPLIERLGLIYMLKIRHGSNFGTPGGAAWRMLFTFSLMPWLRSYLLNNLVYLEEKELRERLGIMSKDDLVDNIVSLEEKYRALSGKLKQLTHEKAADSELANGAKEAAVQSNEADSLGTSKPLRSNVSIMTGIAPETESEVP